MAVKQTLYFSKITSAVSVGWTCQCKIGWDQATVIWKESWTWQGWGLWPMHQGEMAPSQRCGRLWDVSKKNKGVASRKLTWQWNINQVLIGDTSSNGCFSVVTLVFGGVILGIWLGCWNSCRWILQSRHPQMFETIPSTYLLKDCDFMRNHHFKATSFQLLAKNWWGRMMFRFAQFPSSPHPKKNPSIA